MKHVKLLMTFFLLLILTSCSINFNFNETLESIPVNDKLKVHFIDVGQGDAIFIELPNGKTMLIDAGEKQMGSVVEEYIKNLNYDTIDYVIGTHPHTDHIGGLAYILEHFTVKEIYLPKVVHTSKTYENLLLTIKNQGKSVHEAVKDYKIINSANLKAYFISPTGEKSSNLNNYSAVLKIEFESHKFLFMGDAEAAIEKNLSDVAADVIKVGHHGSDSSSSLDFVNKVNAKYAIISVGKDNQYDHPSKEIVKRWQESGATVYRTDINGNILITSDGDVLDVDVGKEEENASNS